MMQITFRHLLFSTIFIISLTFAHPTLAHGDKPRLEINVERANPGIVVEVRGVDFEFEELIVFTLIGPEIEIPFGEITADAEGVFLEIVILPVDLQEGVYHFRAVTDDHEILSPPLLVQGPPLSDDANGGQGQRDQSDSLLAPIPTPLTSVVTAATPRTIPEPAPVTEDSSQKSLIVVMSIAALLTGVTVWIVRKNGKSINSVYSI